MKTKDARIGEEHGNEGDVDPTSSMSHHPDFPQLQLPLPLALPTPIPLA
jgi:hypothetical protein